MALTAEIPPSTTRRYHHEQADPTPGTRGGIRRTRSLGTTGAAFAAGSPNDGATSTTQEQGEASGAEGEQDRAAQDAACKRAGVDPGASNINDDVTGVCTLDGGGADDEAH